MCGIAGIVGSQFESETTVKTMINSIVHRGPDEVGYYVSGKVDIGVCRLSIINIEQNKQPMVFKSYGLVVAFNGEIYNLQELRSIISESGLKVSSRGDTEIIGHLFYLYGEKFVNKISGMFAISIWDEKSGILYLFRDRNGQKPLFYRTLADRTLQFASEVKAFHGKANSSTVDLSKLNSFLVLGYIPQPATPFKDIFSLMPAHYLKWENGAITISKYWDALENEIPIPNSFDETLDVISFLIRDSISSTLVSERELCVLLSGGIDSTLVSHFASEGYGLENKLSTISLATHHNKFDETFYARESSKLIGTNHSVFDFDKSPEILDNYLKTYADIPFADSSVLLMYQLTKHMRDENFIVGLTGDGGDELFAGYIKYLNFIKFLKLRPYIFLNKYFGSIFERKSLMHNNNKIRKFSEFNSSLSDTYLEFNSLIGPKLTKYVWSDSVRESINLSEVNEYFQATWFTSRGDSMLNKLLDFDQKTYLLNDINYKSDISAGANGIELRSPFQDHKLIGFVNNVNYRMKIQNNSNKYILKHLLSQIYPLYNMSRAKYGFGFNRAELIRNEYRDLIYDSLTSKTMRDRGWFNFNNVGKILDMHSQGKDLDNIIWPMFILENWAHNWLD